MKLAGTARPAYQAYHLVWTAVDWIFPPTCGGCGKVGERWCITCQQNLSRVSGPICQRCGEPLAVGGICGECSANPPAVKALRSFGIYEGSLRNAIRQMKYKRDIGLGEALSKHLIELYNDQKWEIDLIVPVPLSSRRMRERGYNQAGLLARPLSYAIGKSFLAGAILRKRETRSQVGLNASERKANTAGAFQARETFVRGKVVLVIDDVATTGATINACAQALCDAGSKAVYGLTLARAVVKTHVDEPANLS
jgi:ComF family protein